MADPSILSRRAAPDPAGAALVARPAIGQARFRDMPQQCLDPADCLGFARERMAAKLQPGIG